MKIGIVGGTGKEGAGLAPVGARPGTTIIIGSRDAERARGQAAELRAVTAAARASGMGNRDAAVAADIVVLTVPATGLAATLPEVREACRGKVVISTVVPLTFGGGRLFTPPPAGSVGRGGAGDPRRGGAGGRRVPPHRRPRAVRRRHAIECDLLICGGMPRRRSR